MGRLELGRGGASVRASVTGAVLDVRSKAAAPDGAPLGGFPDTPARQIKRCSFL